MTTNPTIFATAITGSDAYDGQIRDLAVRGAGVEEALRMITTSDVRGPATCCGRCTTRPTASTGGSPSRSTPGSPTTAEATIAQARQLWWLVDRPNLYIKIPATMRSSRRSPPAWPRASA